MEKSPLLCTSRQIGHAKIIQLVLPKPVSVSINGQRISKTLCANLYSVNGTKMFGPLPDVSLISSFLPDFFSLQGSHVSVSSYVATADIQFLAHHSASAADM